MIIFSANMRFISQSGISFEIFPVSDQIHQRKPCFTAIATRHFNFLTFIPGGAIRRNGEAIIKTFDDNDEAIEPRKLK